MASLTFTESSCLKMTPASDFSKVNHSCATLRGWEIHPIRSTVPCNFRYFGKSYQLPLPRPTIVTNKTDISVDHGRYPFYNNCHQFGIEENVSLHVSLVDDVITQVDDFATEFPSVPFTFLSGEGPASGLLSFSFPCTDSFLTWTGGGFSEYMTCSRIFVESSCHGLGSASVTLYPSFDFWLLLSDIDGVSYLSAPIRINEVFALPGGLYTTFFGSPMEVNASSVIRVAHACDLHVTAAFVYNDGSTSVEGYRTLIRWLENLPLQSLDQSVSSSVSSSYPENSLAKTAFESFRVKDATLLRELMDTMGDLAGIAKITASAIPGVDSLKEIWRARSLPDVFKGVAGTYLAGKFGLEMPIKTLIAWSDVYTSKFRESIEKSIFPTALRSQKTISIVNGKSPCELTGKVSCTMIIGIESFNDWRDYVNAFYRWGLLLSVSDGWELVPLSFVLDWIWSGLQTLTSAISALADSYRLSVRYTCRSYNASLNWKCYGPRDPLYGSSVITFPIRIYDRHYWHESPSLSLFTTLREESSAGTLNISSLPSASALLVSFLT